MTLRLKEVIFVKKPVILVLFGGCSTEYEVSLQSAHGVLSHFPEEYEALTVGITRQGAWLYYPGTLNGILEDRWQAEGIPCALRPDRGARELLVFGEKMTSLPLDGAFPILHGKNGEDGTVQGLLELAGIPLVGCGALAGALCMDKDRSHKLAELAGVRAPRSAVFPAGTGEQALTAAARELGWPLFVKPVRAGSSFGVSRVTGFEQLIPAVEEALRHDGEVILEEAVPGFEVGCAVLGNRELTVGLVDEIELSGGFFDYEEKYTLKTSAIHCPARIAPAKALEIQEAAKKVYRALGCRGFARVDMFLTPGGEIVFNEANTIPGFTPHSRYPSMMKGIGLDFTALVRALIALGLEE